MGVGVDAGVEGVWVCVWAAGPLFATSLWPHVFSCARASPSTDHLSPGL